MSYTEVWDNYYKKTNVESIIYDSWLEKYNHILKETKEIEVIDLGCGRGNNTLFLKERGYKVISCDFSEEALRCLKQLIPDAKVMQFDLSEGLPFSRNNYKVVLADLCLHYFSWSNTTRIVNEIKDILVQNGHLLCRLNSTEDKAYGAGEGEEIEENFYQLGSRTKRFFNEAQIRELFREWQIEYIEKYESVRIKNKILWEVALKKY